MNADEAFKEWWRKPEEQAEFDAAIDMQGALIKRIACNAFLAGHESVAERLKELEEFVTELANSRENPHVQYFGDEIWRGMRETARELMGLSEEKV